MLPYIYSLKFREYYVGNKKYGSIFHHEGNVEGNIGNGKPLRMISEMC